MTENEIKVEINKVDHGSSVDISCHGKMILIGEHAVVYGAGAPRGGYDICCLQSYVSIRADTGGGWVLCHVVSSGEDTGGRCGP